MVNIYYAQCNNNHVGCFINEHIHYLPKPFIEKANTYRFKEDAQRYLLGKILLVKATRQLGYANLALEHLEYTEFSKPYFEASPNFNISHSGNYVLCAISENLHVGIDLEEIKQIDFTEFSTPFTACEWSCIEKSDQPLKTFYRFWTRKEAVIKADGRGMSIPLQSFEVIADNVKLNANKWFIKELIVADGYIAHLATNIAIQDKYLMKQLV